MTLLWVRNLTFQVYMNNKKISYKNTTVNKSSDKISILTTSVLAYCGYRIKNKKLIDSKYEANPYKK